MNTSGTNRSSHSNALTSNSLSDSTIIEQQQRRIEALEAETERIRQAASLDLENWTTKYTGLMRENSRLQGQLVRQEEEEPEHSDVRDLLLLWKLDTHRNSKTDIGTGSKRYNTAKAAIKRWGVERSTNAIRGLALKPYSGPRGRSHEEYLGSKKVADVEHALGDEVRMERCEGYWLEHIQPTLETVPLELVPEAVADQPIAATVERDLDPPPGLLKITPTKGRAGGYWHGDWRDTTPPITKFLASLHEYGHKVTPNPSNPDRWSAQCPAHEDRDPSLSIERKPDGMLLLHCFAGCDIGDITASLNLDVRDLWAAAERDYDRADGPRVQKTVPAHLRQAMQQLLSLETRDAA